MQATFRGTYGNPMLYKPVFNAFSFLPTPPPQEPRKKGAGGVSASPPTTTTAAAAALAASSNNNKKESEEEEKIPTKPRSRSLSFKNTHDDEERKRIEEQTKRDEKEEEEKAERLTGPPEDADVLFSVLDREKGYRSYVDGEGACFNNRGQCIGYINFDTSEAGSASEMFMGVVVEQRFDNVYQVYDHGEELVGYLDMGTATIKNGAHATVADIQATGVVTHPTGAYLGQFVSRHMSTFHHLKAVALYLVLLDPGMLNFVEG